MSATLLMLLLLNTTPEEALALAKKHFAKLDYDQVVPALRPILDDPLVDPALKCEAWVLEGTARGITQDLIDAERPFRKLLRLRPDYELPPKTAPKILAAFRKVQAEERAFAAEVAAADRSRIIAGLKLLDEPPASARGGRAVSFSFRLFDPGGAVAGVVVPYRRAGEASFSTLALQRDETGAWRGMLPGELTANEGGLKLEYFVESRDRDGGPLLVRGEQSHPLLLAVSPGQQPRATLPLPVFYTTLGVTLASGAGLGVVGGLFSQAQSGYNQPGTDFVRAPDRNLVARRADALGTATTALIISTSVLAAATAVMAFFVDWSPPAP